MKKKLMALLLALSCVLGLSIFTACDDVVKESSSMFQIESLIEGDSEKASSKKEESSSEIKEGSSEEENLNSEESLEGNSSEEISSSDDSSFEEVHTHDYQWKYEGDNHWGECVCSEETEVTEHEYSDWTIRGHNHYKECFCGKYISEAHDFVGEADCSVCGIEYYTRELQFGLSDSYYIVTGIGISVDKVVIPAIFDNIPVKEIGQKAFENRYIKNVVIPNTIHAIHERAFYGCRYLEEVTIPDSVTNLGRAAFYWNLNLKSAVIGDGITVLNELLFDGCRSLTKIKLPSNLTYIDSAVFRKCGFEEFVIPDTVETIHIRAFERCQSLKKVTVGENVTRIVEESFNGCTNLTTVINKSSLNIWAGSKGYGKIAYYATEVYQWKDCSSFFAQEYANSFVNIFGDPSSSLSYQLLVNVKQNQAFVWAIEEWERLNLLNSDRLTKKKMYQIALFDVLGVQETEKSKLYTAVANETDDFIYQASKEILGADDISITMLKAMGADVSVLKRAKIFNGLGVAEDIIKVCDNMYDSIIVASQYKALSNMKQGYGEVLSALANDSSNDSALRSAAKECIAYFNQAIDETLEMIVSHEFIKNTVAMLVNDIMDKAWTAMMELAFPGASFVVKGMLWLADKQFNLSERNRSYYLLETTVQLEVSLRGIIQNTSADNVSQSEKYVAAVDMYKNAILRGFDCSKDFAQSYVDSNDSTEEEKENWRGLIQKIVVAKAEQKSLFEQYDAQVREKYQSIFY